MNLDRVPAYRSWKQREGALEVLDPLACRRTRCWVWPHDVLAALGLGGGHVAAPWLRVRALRPTTINGAPIAAQLATDLPFRPSDQFKDGDGRPLPVLAAAKLHADADYDVIIEDDRLAAFDRVGPAERKKLEHTLASREGSAAVAADLEADYARRAAGRREAIDRKLENFTTTGDEAGAGDDCCLEDKEVEAAETLRDAHVRRVDAAEKKIFALVEVAWIQTTLDVEKFKLF